MVWVTELSGGVGSGKGLRMLILMTVNVEERRGLKSLGFLVARDLYERRIRSSCDCAGCLCPFLKTSEKTVLTVVCH